MAWASRLLSNALLYGFILFYFQIPVEVISVFVDPIPLLIFKKQSGWFQCNGEIQYILMTAKEMCIT